MKIVDVRCFTLSGTVAAEPIEERQVGMLDVYEDFAARPFNPRKLDASGRSPISGSYVEIEADDGTVGLFGPIFYETAVLILTKLRPYLLGQDPLATERLWDVMYRQDRHSRKGYEMMAISAADNALWDLKGKHFGQPVYRLLGGPTRSKVDCYASMLGHSLELDRVRERAQWAVAQGFKAQKWFFRYGPTDGLAGMAKNVELVKTVREAVGPNIEIMFDSWMGWDMTYTIRLVERIEQYYPRWVEESVPADRIADFANIRRTSRVPIATGEHEYTRWGFVQLLQANAIDVIQADPDWCGGISELVKIVSLASAFGRHVIPHGHSIHASVHVVASQSPATCPMAETLLLHLPPKQAFHTELMAPVNGSIPLPTAPGLGFALDESKIEKREPVTV
ncbi:MAG: enolase C-terminal domain-like protein [Chloroflexota bacterium]